MSHSHTHMHTYGGAAQLRKVHLTVSLSWPSALTTLCSTHCSHVNAILPKSRTLDGYPPYVKTGQQLYITRTTLGIRSALKNYTWNQVSLHLHSSSCLGQQQHALNCRWRRFAPWPPPPGVMCRHAHIHIPAAPPENCFPQLTHLHTGPPLA